MKSHRPLILLVIVFLVLTSASILGVFAVRGGFNPLFQKIGATLRNTFGGNLSYAEESESYGGRYGYHGRGFYNSDLERGDRGYIPFDRHGADFYGRRGPYTKPVWEVGVVDSFDSSIMSLVVRDVATTSPVSMYDSSRRGDDEEHGRGNETMGVGAQQVGVVPPDDAATSATKKSNKTYELDGRTRIYKWTEDTWTSDRRGDADEDKHVSSEGSRENIDELSFNDLKKGRRALVLTLQFEGEESPHVRMILVKMPERR